MAINVPTQVTLGRLALAVLFIALLSWFNPMRLEEQRWLLQVCFWLFLVAAVSDVLDGLLARMMRSVTSLGRMLDPVADKVMICGAFVLFASHHFWDGSRNLTDVRPWMVVVILTRELIVSVARSHSEGAGRTFGASWAGKLKMFVQSATVCVILGQLAWNVAGAEPIRTACVWLTVVVTALSALTYLRELRALVAAKETTGNQEDVTVVDSGATLGGSPGGPTS
jgi:CDP-diacylglycerol--glycerol-3-phosphate 3-phosphatidyltransferase